MIIKLVNPDNKDEICLYGKVASFRISTKGSTPISIDEEMEKRGAMYEAFISNTSKRPTRRLFLTMSNHWEWYDIITNWNIYLMDDNGETIESL